MGYLDVSFSSPFKEERYCHITKAISQQGSFESNKLTSQEEISEAQEIGAESPYSVA